MPKPLPPGVLPGQLSLGEEFEPFGELDPSLVAEASLATLATKEEGSQRCQVCDFPALAGQVEGVIDGERYSLRICQSCLQHAVLCLRDSYRQNRLFDDDFEISELCGFGKVSPDLKGGGD